MLKKLFVCKITAFEVAAGNCGYCDGNTGTGQSMG